nr:alpha/beta fold hydrolase [uncultured Capnocytophaga sp.]
MNANKKLPLEYIIRYPELRNKRSPVIFMIHGYGSNEEDLFSFADALPSEYTIISFRAPYHLASFGYAWYMINFDTDTPVSDNEQAMAARDLIMQSIDEACTLYDLDTKNITILGFSQGSILGMAVALSYPKKIRNVIALSGYLNKDILKEGYERENHTFTHFYVSHGASDQVIPVEWARQTPNFLKALGVKYKYEEFPVGHGVSPQNFYSFRDWLTK